MKRKRSKDYWLIPSAFFRADPRQTIKTPDGHYCNLTGYVQYVEIYSIVPFKKKKSGK